MHALFPIIDNRMVILMYDESMGRLTQTLHVQALNNWGLVLQELSKLRPAEERATWVGAAVAKFRRAIRQQPDFDRACYNLGTVYYAHAGALQEIDGTDSEVGSLSTTSLQTCFSMGPRAACIPAFSMHVRTAVVIRGVRLTVLRLVLDTMVNNGTEELEINLGRVS